MRLILVLRRTSITASPPHREGWRGLFSLDLRGDSTPTGGVSRACHERSIGRLPPPRDRVLLSARLSHWHGVCCLSRAALQCPPMCIAFARSVRNERIATAAHLQLLRKPCL